MKRIVIDDWSMPNPFDPDLTSALHTARYHMSILTQSQAFAICAAAEAYLHFASHPADTASIISQLRKLRARVRADDSVPFRDRTNNSHLDKDEQQ